MDHERRVLGAGNVAQRVFLAARHDAIVSALSLVLFCFPAAYVSAAEVADVPEIVQSSHFREHHPDIRFRLQGLDASERGADEEAFTYFLKASHFADKESQAIVAEMLWNGRGTKQDRPLAYAWMDLAAERGYPLMVAVREHYWNDMTEQERRSAIDRGHNVYSQYGDDVAKPRMEESLRRMRHAITGSRVGAMGSKLDVLVVHPSGMWTRVPGTVAYQPRYFRAEEYWQWQDERLGRIPVGRVDVGDVEPEQAQEQSE